MKRIVLLAFLPGSFVGQSQTGHQAESDSPQRRPVPVDPGLERTSGRRPDAEDRDVRRSQRSHGRLQSGGETAGRTEQGFWLTLDADGENLPSDWYLKLSGEITKRFHGEPGRPDFTLTFPQKGQR